VATILEQQVSWFFSDPAAVQRLSNAAAEWMYTPFRPFSRAKGRDGGIDCVGLCEVLMVAAGVACEGDFTFARHSSDYQAHRTELKVLKYLRGQLPEDESQSTRLAKLFVEIRLPEDHANMNPAIFMPGDLLVLRQGGMFHLPVLINPPFFVHCLRPLGVSQGVLGDTTFSQHIDAAFRARAL
jgi:hypothetical protein